MTRVLHERARALLWLLALATLPLLLLACAPEQGEAHAQDVAEERLRLEIDQSARELHVYLDGERIATHEIAVGEEEYPTPTGEFAIHQVDWNPDWTPPDSDWSADREFKEPGDPDNPMGRARLSYEGAYSIHGTEALESLGTAASHGSVRVANEVAMELARLVMEYGGAAREESWYAEARANPTEMREVRIPTPVPLVIYE
jgi:murein L,D-transpeptidase YcbB/YkuD